MNHDLDILAQLADTVARNARKSPGKSYTARLLHKGIEHCAKKLGEEGVETALAAMTGDKAHLTEEAADLLYHLVVLLKARDVKLAAVMAELGQRTKRSGLEEKAARNNTPVKGKG